MATTRNAVPIQEVVTWHGAQRILKLYGPSAGIAIAAADVTTINNVVQLFTVPKGFTITGVRLDCTRLDSNGSPTLTLDIGDTTTTNRLVQASTIAQAAESQSTRFFRPACSDSSSRPTRSSRCSCTRRRRPLRPERSS